jgi:hypothetical protein
MNEKEIVIKLTPEQLESLRLLAYEAGYTSVDSFARDKLSALLERPFISKKVTDSVPVPVPVPVTDDPDEGPLKRAFLELKRIKQELRVFINESLHEFQEVNFNDTFESAQQRDELEELADKALANSPQLGLLSHKVKTMQDQLSKGKQRSDEGKFDRTEIVGERALTEEEGGSWQAAEDDLQGPRDSDVSGGPPPRKRSK